MTHAVPRFALIVCLCLCLAGPVALAAETRYVTDRILAEMHAQPDAKSPVLASLPTGTPLELLGVSGSFAQVVTADAKRGWIANELLSVEQPALVTLLRLRDEQARTRAELERVREEKAVEARWSLVLTGGIALLLGFVLGAVWLDHRIRVRHGGFRI